MSKQITENPTKDATAPERTATGENGNSAASPTPPPRTNIEVDESKAVVCYANFCRVTGTPEELILDFGLDSNPFGAAGTIADEPLRELLSMAERLLEQTRTSKNKIYSVHAPEVECLAKGKAHKRYEFGCKTSVATTSKNNWIVACEALHGNPYDGHALQAAIAQVERLTGQTPGDVLVDQGFRGHDYVGSAIVHVVRSIPKRATRAVRRMLKRRAAVEPTIGHLKTGNRMSRNYLSGQEGDKINALLAAAGYNLRKLLRWLAFAPIIWLWYWLAGALTVKTDLHNAPSRTARAGFAPTVV